MNIWVKTASLISALAFASQAQASNLLVNGSFEDRVVTASDITNPGGPWSVRDFGSTPGWTQFADGVDLIHNNYVQLPIIPVLVDASDGVNFLDMNQVGLLGGLYQTVAATSGQVFNLSLDTTAWATNSLGGTLGYELYDPFSNTVLASGSYTDSVGGAWITRTLSAAATSSSIGVRVQALFSSGAGPGLDNVILTTPTAPIPEPTSWALMIGGFGVVGATMRRRRAAQLTCA
ncbi:PEPxxWA-CTERM sorting domain-containing protein [Phenylobacterium sp.]|uniref:PEPxxWA-CTERM sorting domain-containing protein n=1 Tax=Phenylobacterium sp. TaxID=1871053 RepID=UPI0037C5C34B